jgi:hypothetical protein
VIVTRVKQVLQSVEEATPTQISTDLGADRAMVEASLEHLRVLGRVRVQSRPRATAGFWQVDGSPEAHGAGTLDAEGGLQSGGTLQAVGPAGAAASERCRPSTVCASCPLVPACDAASRREASTSEADTDPDSSEPRYAWIPRATRRERVG